MEYKHSKNMVSFAKQLRKNMTKEERHLWYDCLRTYKPRFLRQKPIGKYIVDFYCAEVKLVVELDGSQHYNEEEQKKDDDRTAFLKKYGITVLRIPNNQINLNFCGVCEYIDHTIQSLSLPAADSSLCTREP